MRLCKYGKKFSIAFIKYFSKSIRQMKGNCVYLPTDSKHFLNTRSRQSPFLVANQNAHLITHKPMKFRVTKVKIKFKFVESASEQASVVKILLNLWKISKCPKFGENRRKVQNIYYSVRKELLDECHCA